MTQTSVCVDTAIAFLIMIACGHFRLIQVRLAAIARDIDDNEESRKPGKAIEGDGKTYNDPDKSDRRIRKRLRDCVSYHREILM